LRLYKANPGFTNLQLMYHLLISNYMKRLHYTSLLLFATLFAILAACSGGSEEDPNPNPQPQPQPQPQQCDTNNVTFSATVAPILAANCYSCHSTAIATSGVVLDTYNGVKKQASNGTLIGVITHAPGFPPMPDGGGKLSDCNIAKIKKWIDAGAPNN
jgi:hypothetical protein